MTIDIRRAAVLSVRRIIDQSGYASLVISQTLDSFGPQADDRDRRFYTNLVYTTVSHRETIDGYIAASSKVSLKKMDSFVRNVLRVGVCQLLYFDEVRPYAAVNESVRLVRSSRLKNLAPFTNAVLRSV
ncbi:MAG TPA: 16S rRNA (cytosine(967)-C(5))-methyltransferase RsmB, partial [Lachnospiraceae bacterium]|nr:16S rRNA (cytosine(967)-C(5))-methyltransferase RsmB [Lachnospiraceae bacterium]